jgi:hypothetical protein
MKKAPLALALVLAMTCSAANAAEKPEAAKQVDQPERADPSKTDQVSRADQATVSRAIESWPGTCEEISAEDYREVWSTKRSDSHPTDLFGNGPWKYTIVYRAFRDKNVRTA